MGDWAGCYLRFTRSEPSSFLRKEGISLHFLKGDSENSGSLVSVPDSFWQLLAKLEAFASFFVSAHVCSRQLLTAHGKDRKKSLVMRMSGIRVPPSGSFFVRALAKAA